MFKDTAPIENIANEIITGTDELHESWQTTIIANEKDKAATRRRYRRKRQHRLN